MNYPEANKSLRLLSDDEVDLVSGATSEVHSSTVDQAEKHGVGTQSKKSGHHAIRLQLRGRPKQK